MLIGCVFFRLAERASEILVPFAKSRHSLYEHRLIINTAPHFVITVYLCVHFSKRALFNMRLNLVYLLVAVMAVISLSQGKI